MSFDLRIESRFKNALVFRALDEFLGPGWTQHQAAEYCGVRDTDFGKILCLKESPRLKHGEGYRLSHQKVANKLGYEPSELFPDTLYSLNLPGVVVREYESPYVLSLQEAQKAGLLPASEPKQLCGIEETEGGEAVSGALKELSPREEYVLRHRFGLDGEEESLREIGNHFGVTAQRVRQMEAKALRKMRHPSRSAGLRGLLSGVGK